MTKKTCRTRNRMRVRIEDLWEPQWDDIVVGWTKNFIRQNYWRTETYNDKEDLLQDAYVVFMKVRDSYPQVVEAPLFMKLYKTALWRAFMDKGRKLKNDILATRQAAQEAAFLIPELKTYNEGPLNVLLSEGPPEIRMLMEFINNDSNLEKLRQPQRKSVNSEPRMNIDQRISALLGIPYFPFREVMTKWLFA